MLDHEELLPVEQEEENQLLIKDLGRYFDTQAEDRASLANIRARLLQKTATSLPVAENTGEVEAPTPLPMHRGRNTRMKLIKRHPYLNTLAAAILLVLLVGSFALAIKQGLSTIAGSGTATAHGWSILKSFSGTGNKTIDGLDIEVGHKYGWFINCTNTSSGMVSVAIDGNDSGGAVCGVNASGPLAPEGSVSSPDILPPVLAIKVTADASISWELWLFKGVYYPPLNMYDADFQPLHDEMDGTGNMIVAMDVTLPETFALGFECHGSGTFRVEIPNLNGYTSACDGQPHFNVDDLGAPGTVVQQIQITTSSENDWQVILAGCTNTRPSCGTRSGTPTVTP